MRASTILAILLLAVMALSFLPLPRVRAAAPTNIQITSGNSVGVVPSYQTQLSFNANIFADSVGSDSKTFINFKNAAYSTSTTTTQTFGAASCCSSTGVSIAINAIAADHIEVVATFISGNPTVYLNYTIPSTYPFTEPQSVVYTQGTSQSVIQQNQYETSGAFTCGVPPCVYETRSNNTLVLRGGSASPFTVDWYFPVFGNGLSCGILNFPICGGGGTGTGGNGGTTITTTTATPGCIINCGGGGGGGGNGVVIILPTTTSTTTSASTNSTAAPSGPPDYTKLGLVLIIGIIASSTFVGLTSRAKGSDFRAPDVGKAVFGSPSSGKAQYRHSDGGRARYRKVDRGKPRYRKPSQ